MTRVKICGNTHPEDARLAAELGADYLGFIFTESKRRVTPAQVREMMAAVPHFQNFVGVFSNQPKEEVQETASVLGLKILQFHGEETALYCAFFEKKGYRVIKTFRIKDSMSLKRLDEYNVNYFLFDAYRKEEKGGTGQAFDWNVIEDRPYVHEMLFLAGGLNVGNVAGAIARVQPYAVDVASGVEKSPGRKDHDLLAQFISIAKGTAHAGQGTVHS